MGSAGSKEAFERKLAAVEALRKEDAAAVVEPLRKALKDRNNYLVSKAAAVAADMHVRALIPDLEHAFARFLEDGAKTDPKCWAKNALAKALKNLESDGSELFLRGLAHQQWEPVWGGREDAAETLRGICAHALTQSSLTKLEVLHRLSDLLVDHSKAVRIEAARAIGGFGGMEGALLLRLKARTGDAEPEVTGQCLSALVAAGMVELVKQFLAADDTSVRMEAAAALAESRDAEAIRPLEAFWWELRDPRDKRALLKLLAVSPAEAAGELLQRLGEDESDAMAAEARAAYRASRHARG